MNLNPGRSSLCARPSHLGGSLQCPILIHMTKVHQYFVIRARMLMTVRIVFVLPLERVYFILVYLVYSIREVYSFLIYKLIFTHRVFLIGNITR